MDEAHNTHDTGRWVESMQETHQKLLKKYKETRDIRDYEAYNEVKKALTKYIHQEIDGAK